MTVAFAPPGPLVALAAAVAAAGGRAFAVGGCVRDHLMGLPIKDWDVEVFGVPADDLPPLLRRFGKVDAVGRSFGVYKLSPRGGRPGQQYDVSVPRRDSKVGPGHRGIAVDGDPTMTIPEAARRRDLTVNAIMIDLATGAVEDPWGGLRDIAARRLRAVDDATFLEDPLRALRVAQFAARLGFEPVPELVALCRSAELGELPAERVQAEWEKLLLRGARPSAGMAFAREAEILSRVFPAVRDDPATDAALDALVPVRAALAPEGRQWALMLSGWLATQDRAAVEDTLDRLWLHRWKGYAVREAVLAQVGRWRDPCGDDAELRWLASRCEAGIALAVREAMGEPVGDARARVHELGIAEGAPPPLLLGRHLKDLGVAPGPAMGTVLRRVYEAQLDGDVATVEDAIARARTELPG